ncbi:MAG: universal stress protein [Desulfovibrionaceae bacterium]|nr:universal stress protein [Desulfovibrionaceae bacterium]
MEPINRHLLVTVSEDQKALCAARFVSAFFDNKQDVECTLLYVATDPARTASKLDVHRDMGRFAAGKAKARGRGEAAMARARDFLESKGFPAANIHDKLKFKEFGTAKDIIFEGVRGIYDAVVLGRRGLGWLQELVEDSVTSTLAATHMEVPVWVTRMPDAGRRNLLLCVDGSEEGLRAADHAGFILSTEPGHSVRVFHIWDPVKEDEFEARYVVDQALLRLAENGVDGPRVSWEIVRGAGYARMIMAEAERGAYAAVVVGATGADRPPLGRLIMGSVSLKLLRSLEMDRAALWIVH